MSWTNLVTKSTARNLLLAVLLLVVGHSLLPSAPNFDEHLPLRDEIGWLAISHDTYQKFVHEDLSAVDWREGLQKTTYGAMNPNLAKLVFGWILAQKNYNLPTPRVFPVIHPEAKGRMKNERFVRSQVSAHEPFMMTLRRFDLWVMALAAVGFFWVGTLVGGPVMGVVAWYLFVQTPDIQEIAPLIMTDNLLMLFFGFGLACSMLVLRRCTQPISWFQGAALLGGVGLLLGMAPSTKLNGALNCIGFGLAFVGCWAARKFRCHGEIRPWLGAGFCALFACGFFLLLYPLLWHDPRAELDFVFERWDNLIAGQVQHLPHIALNDLSARMQAVWQRGVLDVGPNWLPTWVWVGVILGGFVLLLKQTWESLRQRQTSPYPWVLFCFCAVWCIETTAWIPLDWTRYYLPVMVSTCFLAALCMSGLARFLHQPLRKFLALWGASSSVAALVMLSLVFGSCSRADTAPKKPPHILFLSVDTLRPDYLSMNGYDRETSPYLDSLLADAFHFPKAVATVPRTTPSLASFLTGSYPHTTGVRVLRHALRDEVVPITEVLKAQGYHTLAVVTNQMLGPERKLNRGFDAYLNAKDTRDAQATTDVLLEQLAQTDFQQPLFLWAHYIDPHMPYVSDPSIIQTFDPKYQGRYATHFGQFPPEHPPQQQNGKQTKRWRQGPYPPDLPKSVAVHRNPLPEEVVAHVRRLYAADVRSTDDQIRRLVERLLESTDGNLLIVFTADHGESLGEHNFYWDHGDYVYNAASRIPLAILPPKGHPARHAGRYNHWVSNIDIVPTVLDLVGIPMPPAMKAHMDGRSLAPAMLGESLPEVPVFVESGHSHFFSLVRGRASNDTAGKFRAVYSGDWKLIWAPGHKDPKLSWQIYNLADDPHEEHNLFSPDHPQFQRLKSLLVPWAEKSFGEVEQGPASAKDLESMRELGYIDSGNEH